MHVPLDLSLQDIEDIPYTISYVIRKRLQVDSLNELPKEKRPPDFVLWSSNPEDLDDWMENVVYDYKKKHGKSQDVFELPRHLIE